MGWKNGTLETKNLRIQITNQHISYKGTWVIHVRELNWNCRILGIPDDSTEKFAQEEAIRQIRQQMILMIEDLKP